MYKVTFNNKNRVFFNTLKREVDSYFEKRRLEKTGNWKLYLKTGVLVPSAILIYIFLLAYPWSLAGMILMSALLGIILASIGFNVMHDANHGSYSSKKWVNELLGYSLNVLGGNAFIWKIKHNVIHHTYTNVDGIDDDIALTKLLRQAETQKWTPKHRLQHIYVFGIYAITSIAWAFFTDFKKYFSKKIQQTPIKGMDTREHVIFWVSKLVYVGIYVLLPLLLKGWVFWLVCFLSMHIVLGFTLAIVFQLAHVVEHTEFEVATVDPKLIENEWAIHQVKTTANFAPRNKLISWYVGGLNYQIEHHLFPRISHIHYPAISRIVKRICRQFNIPYNEFPTMGQAVSSHFRMMKRFGRKPALVRS